MLIKDQEGLGELDPEHVLECIQMKCLEEKC